MSQNASDRNFMLVAPYCGLISSLEPEIENLPKDGHLQLVDTNPFPRWCPLIRGSTVLTFHFMYVWLF